MAPGRRTNEERARVRRATGEAFSQLETRLGLEIALASADFPYSAVPRELIDMIDGDTQLDKVFMDEWAAACNAARSRQSGRAAPPQPKKGTQMPIPAPLDWPIVKKRAPTLSAGTRMIRVRLTYSGDLVGNPWATQLPHSFGVGVSIRRQGGNSYNQWMEMHIWGLDENITEAREWVKDLGARWEVQSETLAA